jgi:hypothetical protein
MSRILSRMNVTLLTGLGCVLAGAVGGLSACNLYDNCLRSFADNFNSFTVLGTFYGFLAAMPATAYLAITEDRYLRAKSVFSILVTWGIVTVVMISFRSVN